MPVPAPVPLPPGQSTSVRILAVFDNPSPAELCWDIVARSADCENCCKVTYCFQLRRSCATLTQQRIIAVTNSLYSNYSFNLDREGAKSRISSRPSDAIALAVRFGGDIPIFADEEVLDEAGVLFEADDEEQEVAQFRQFLEEITPEDFAQ